MRNPPTALGTSPATWEGWLVCKLACSLGCAQILSTHLNCFAVTHSWLASLPATLQPFLIVSIPEQLVTAAGGNYQFLAFSQLFILQPSISRTRFLYSELS